LEEEEDAAARIVLADLLAAELRHARARYQLSNSSSSGGRPAEILLPAGILQRIAGDILEASAEEPCGIRYVFINILKTKTIVLIFSFKS